MATDVRRLRRLLTTLGAVFGVAMLLGSLALLAESTQNRGQFGQTQLVILASTAMGVAVMCLLILFALVRLAREYARGEAGSRLKVRMVSIFAVLSLLPVLIVFAFSLQFITRGIDSWFDDDVGQGLSEALSLARLALDARKDEFRATTLDMADSLAGLDDVELYGELDRLRERFGAQELTVLASSGRILALSAGLPNLAEQTVAPSSPSLSLPPLRQGEAYVEVEPLPAGGLLVRTAVHMDAPTSGEHRVLVGVFSVPERFSELAETVQGAYTAYARSDYLRQPLKFSFALTLTLVLLLSALSAVWGAIFAARRVVAPIQDLVAGTRAVAEGDFSRKLPVPTRDDIGFLVNSFNDMTERLGQAQALAQRARQATESERGKLSTILASLSTGVVALEPDQRVRVANTAAETILGITIVPGQRLKAPPGSSVALERLLQVAQEHFAAGRRAWREQIAFTGERGPRVLMCASAILPGDDPAAQGSVLVFDEVTRLMRAQRDAAWGEVARRLAHEIKNPLTPIKLSAERVRRRYLRGDDGGDDMAVLDRATHTIIQQVDAMRGMVDAFRDYARAPELNLSLVDVNRIVSEVVELYRDRELPVRVEVATDPDLPPAEADGDRLRQILHNLITNAIEALSERTDGRIRLFTALQQEDGHDFVQLRVEDNGHGFQLPSVAHVFEPYVTTKEKGTGLGLAIVRKIVEEHGGGIELGDMPAGEGAWVSIVLPRDADARAYAAARLAAGAEDYRAPTLGESGSARSAVRAINT
ncbi:MAG: ATP-binding protein [Pseudomonadota bacterium]